MNVCVFCGSSMGNNADFQSEAKKVGNLIGRTKNTLVFGGSHMGIMKIISESAKEAGANIISVQLDIFYEEKGHTIDFSDELYVTKSFQERKLKMTELSDIFIAFPGGIGTIDELSDVLVSTQFYFTGKHIVIYNLNGYFNDFIEMLKTSIKYGFMKQEVLDNIHIIDNISTLKEYIENIHDSHDF